MNYFDFECARKSKICLSLLFFPLSLAGSGKVGEILSSRIHFFYQKRNEFCPVFHLFFDFFFEKKRIPEKFSLKSKIFDLRAHSKEEKKRENEKKERTRRDE